MKKYRCVEDLFSNLVGYISKHEIVYAQKSKECSSGGYIFYDLYNNDRLYAGIVSSDSLNKHFEIYKEEYNEECECTVTTETTKEIFKGWDVIRLAHEGKLKEGTIITNVTLGDKYIYEDKFIRDVDGNYDIELYQFIGHEFEIEEPKRLVDFNTALKEKLNIRHKDWDKSVKATTVQNICVEFSKCTHEEIADMLTGECWEVES